MIVIVDDGQAVERAAGVGFRQEQPRVVIRERTDRRAVGDRPSFGEDGHFAGGFLRFACLPLLEGSH